VGKLVIDQETQVGNSDSYDDSLPSGSTLQTDVQNLRDDLNALRSQFKRVIHGSGFGKWFDDPETVFGSDASLKALLNSIGNAGQIRSDTGQYTVPSGLQLRRLVYLTGPDTVEHADNSAIATAPVIGMSIEKPTSTTATIVFYGVITGFTGLTPGTDLFLGTDGQIIVPPLPTTPGTVIQKVGQALTSTVLLLDPDTPVVL